MARPRNNRTPKTEPVDAAAPAALTAPSSAEVLPEPSRSQAVEDLDAGAVTQAPTPAPQPEPAPLRLRNTLKAPFAVDGLEWAPRGVLAVPALTPCLSHALATGVLVAE